MDHVVVDVEIQKTIEETPGRWDSTHLLGVAVACVWEYQTQRMRVYGPDDVEALRERLLKANRISGFNIFNFDFPVIWGIRKSEWVERVGLGFTNEALKMRLSMKTDDMLCRIWQALRLNPDRFVPKTHGGWSLDDVAGCTIKSKKIGHGADAPKWFQAGKIQQVVNYCADDVAIKRDLTDFVEKYGYVLGTKQAHPLVIPPWKV